MFSLGFLEKSNRDANYTPAFVRSLSGFVCCTAGALCFNTCGTHGIHLCVGDGVTMLIDK